jgi:cob(I)alamin adenosyltransferase
MAELPVIQRELIELASNLAFSGEEAQQFGIQNVDARQVARLEDLTDELSQELGPLGSFILPRGSQQAKSFVRGRTRQGRPAARYPKEPIACSPPAARNV